MNTQVKESLSDLADDSHALLNATANATEESMVEARNRLQSALDAAGEACAQVKAKAIQGAKATDKAIRANPYQAMGVAFGVGALVGYLISRRNRD